MPQHVKDYSKRVEFLKEYSIGIRFLSTGCVVDVGCKSFAFSTIKEAMEELNKYVINPEKTRKIWEEKLLTDEQL